MWNQVPPSRVIRLYTGKLLKDLETHDSLKMGDLKNIAFMCLLLFSLPISGLNSDTN